MRTDAPSAAFPRFLREPAPEEWVQLTANWLASTSAGPELEALSDQLMKEHAQDAAELPQAEFSNGGRALPVERVPAKFRESGGTLGARRGVRADVTNSR